MSLKHPDMKPLALLVVFALNSGEDLIPLGIGRSLPFSGS